jgi:hypothetical protein
LEIRDTFKRAPKEFAFSNNGLTVLCEKLHYDPGVREARIVNPRIVNGSQTLHSIRDVENPSSSARVMVRVIEIPALSSRDISRDATRRKEIVHKISIRSNRQNDIKKWDLVSNDDFQHEIARFFRSKNLYYERRRKEWAARRTELRSVGISKGPDIRILTQLVASYFWENKSLGPVVAKTGLSELFDGREYEEIKKVTPELAYQLYLLDCIIKEVVAELWGTKLYIRALARHMNFTLFALIVRALQAKRRNWGETDFSEELYNTPATPTATWKRLVGKTIALVHGAYRSEATAYRRQKGRMLPITNYFKSSASVGRLFLKPLPREIRSAANAV